MNRLYLSYVTDLKHWVGILRIRFHNKICFTCVSFFCLSFKSFWGIKSKSIIKKCLNACNCKNEADKSMQSIFYGNINTEKLLFPYLIQLLYVNQVNSIVTNFLLTCNVSVFRWNLATQFLSWYLQPLLLNIDYDDMELIWCWS